MSRRGSESNPDSRFSSISRMLEPGEELDPATEIYPDKSKTILSRNESPDVPFSQSINPYRGCEHGCIYCYARPTHEYLDLSPGKDFESKIFVKYEAAQLLRKEITKSAYTCDVIAMAGVTDAYQPVERKLQISRQCLTVLRDFKNPVWIVTKNHLVTRDADLLAEMASQGLASVVISVTTLSEELRGKMEPRTSSVTRRLDAIRRLAEAGVPVGVLVAPVIPGLTDHEIPAILTAAKECGAAFASYVMLRLPHAVKDLFQEWLEAHFPDRKNKIIDRILSMRGGRLYDSRFETRGRGEGNFAEQIEGLFRLSARRAGLGDRGPALRTDLFEHEQGTLF